MEETTEFKWAVRVVLKRQMRNLLSQLEEAGEEVAVMSVNIEDRTCHHFGSPAGEGFISEQQHLTKNFLNYCEKYNKRSGARSLLLPDDLSSELDGTERRPGSTVTAENLLGSPGKALKRPVLDTDGPKAKMSRQDATGSSIISTRSGRKISAKYLDSIWSLSKGSKKQTKYAQTSREDEVYNGSNYDSESIPVDDKTAVPRYFDGESDVDDQFEDNLLGEEDNAIETDPDFKPVIRVTSDARPANFLSIDVKRRMNLKKPKKKKSITETTMMECEQCGIHIKGRTNLKSHIRRVHLKEKNYKCQVCQLEFYSSTSMENHKLSIHTRKCNACGEYVVEVEPWKDGINNRSRRRVVCACGAEVVVFSAFGRAATSPEDIVDLDDTDSRNGSSNNLDNARYACATCGKLFLRKYLCMKHSKRHSQEMPIVCDVCGQTFRYENSLKKHLEKEHGVMKLVCEVCGKNCSNENVLKVHMSKVHGADRQQTIQQLSQNAVAQSMGLDANMSSLHVVGHQEMREVEDSVHAETVQLIVNEQDIISSVDAGTVVTVITTDSL